MYIVIVLKRKLHSYSKHHTFINHCKLGEYKMLPVSVDEWVSVLIFLFVLFRYIVVGGFMVVVVVTVTRLVKLKVILLSCSLTSIHTPLTTSLHNELPIQSATINNRLPCKSQRTFVLFVAIVVGCVCVCVCVSSQLPTLATRKDEIFHTLTYN